MSVPGRARAKSEKYKGKCKGGQRARLARAEEGTCGKSCHTHAQEVGLGVDSISSDIGVSQLCGMGGEERDMQTCC